MIILGIKATINLVLFIITSFVIVITFNYLLNNEFKTMMNNIKRVVSSHQANKTTQIKNILYNYFFEE